MELDANTQLQLILFAAIGFVSIFVMLYLTKQPAPAPEPEESSTKKQKKKQKTVKKTKPVAKKTKAVKVQEVLEYEDPGVDEEQTDEAVLSFIRKESAAAPEEKGEDKKKKKKKNKKKDEVKNEGKEEQAAGAPEPEFVGEETATEETDYILIKRTKVTSQTGTKSTKLTVEGEIKDVKKNAPQKEEKKKSNKPFFNTKTIQYKKGVPILKESLTPEQLAELEKAKAEKKNDKENKENKPRRREGGEDGDRPSRGRGRGFGGERAKRPPPKIVQSQFGVATLEEMLDAITSSQGAIKVSKTSEGKAEQN